MGDVFRYNLSEYDEFREFLEKNIAYIFSKEKVDILDDLKNNLVEEKNYTKRAVSTLINSFLKLKNDDYLFIKKDDKYAIGKVISKPVLSLYGLVVNVEFKMLNKENINTNILDSFKGRPLQRIGYANIYEDSKNIFDNAAIKNKEENSIVLRNSHELLIYDDQKNKKDSIKISYNKKKKNLQNIKDSGKFELILEMKEKYEDSANNKKEDLKLLPMVYEIENKKDDAYFNLCKSYIDFNYNMTFLYLKMLREFQINFAKAYLNLFK